MCVSVVVFILCRGIEPGGDCWIITVKLKGSDDVFQHIWPNTVGCRLLYNQAIICWLFFQLSLDGVCSRQGTMFDFWCNTFIDYCTTVDLLLLKNACFYLQLLILQQSYDQWSHIAHGLLVTHEGEQVVKYHDLEVCQHCVASMPGAAASNLQYTKTTEPSHSKIRPWDLFFKWTLFF